ncbi:LysR family transcriptional regulator [Rhodanobacter aciditrophus]|uniref:LysR family transcriptional regulator n=1 Tax=Rhodanobacter aciditrophus TaxID=1623218 RepID=A0ABW4AZT1_9GAMM
MYDLSDLQSFVSVIETGSLGASAKELGVSKSTLSRRISHLEDVLKQPLMRRQANRIFANDAGRAFLPYANTILEMVGRAHRKVDELKETVSGKLKVALFSGLSRSWVTREIFKYLAEYPEINIDVYTVSALEDVQSATDVVIWIGELEETDLKTELMGEMRCGLYASPDYLTSVGVPETIDELGQKDWVNLHNFYSSDHMLSLFHEEHGYASLKMPTSRLSTDLMSFHLDAIVNGRGIGVLPEYLVASRAKFHSDDLEMVLPEWQAPSLPLYLMYPYGHLPKRCQEFMKQIKKAYQATL